MEYIKKYWFVILFVTVFFAVSILPQFFRDLFLDKDAKAPFIGYQIGGLLSFLILFKWKHVRLFFYLVIGLTCVTDIFMLAVPQNNHFENLLYLLIIHLLLLVVFTFSKRINEYIGVNKIVKNIFT